MTVNGICIDQIILFIVNTYCYITLIASGKSKKQFNRIISCFLGFNGITQIVTIAWLVIQFVYPANRLKATNLTAFCNTEVRVRYCVFQAFHCCICSDSHFFAFVLWFASFCLQVVKFCFFVYRHFCRLSYQITTAHIVTANVHIQALITEENPCRFLCHLITVAKAVCPPAK